MNEQSTVTLPGGLRFQQGERVITRFKYREAGALAGVLAYRLREVYSRK